MEISFTAHNIRLDTGAFTKPDAKISIENTPWFVSARRILNTVFPEKKNRVRLADLGCLEGGYAVEFARMGFQVVGVEVRESNIAACNYVKANTNLPNLEFIQDDAKNIEKYGAFDAGVLRRIVVPPGQTEAVSPNTIDGNKEAFDFANALLEPY